MYKRLLESLPSGSTVWDYCTHEAAKGIDLLTRSIQGGHEEVLPYFLSLLKANDHFLEDKCEVILNMAKYASPTALKQIRIWIGNSVRKDYVLKYLSRQF